MKKEKLETLLVSYSTTVKRTMELLSATATQILFVVDREQSLIGTVTDGDIRRGLLKGAEFNDEIGTIMFCDFISICDDETDKLQKVKQIMLDRLIEQIPVLDDRGRIRDVILWTDLFEAKKKIPATLKTNPVVIMAGGKGTRLDPFTRIFPKPLIPIGNKPVIEHIMKRFYHYGFHRFLYTLNYKKEYLKLYFRENQTPYEIDWVEEEDFLGTAGSLSLLTEKIDDTFFVINCDSILDIDLHELLKWHKQENAAITIVGCHNEVRIPFGILHLSEDRLERIVEKPIHDVIINTGAYIMEPHVLPYVPVNKTIDMNELIERVSEKEKISVYTIYDGWFDIGQLNEYKKYIETVEGN
jgi:dTDP-glucose pyrophosphorylase